MSDISSTQDIPQIHLMLGNSDCKKSFIKKLLNFSKKVHRHFKTILHLCLKHLRRHYPLKIRPDFDLEGLEIFSFRKYAFLVLFRYLQVSFAVKYFGVDQVLGTMLQIDQKLTFHVFHILNQGLISKIEKISDGTDPPPKWSFFRRV